MAHPTMCAVSTQLPVRQVEGAPQRWAIDRLLQNRNAGEAVVDCVGGVAGDEHERDAAAGELLRERIDLLAREIDVEDRSHERVAVEILDRVGDLSERTDHMKPDLRDQ